MKKVLKYIVGVALLPLALAGCTSNFDEYNTNPYEPTTLDVRQFFAEMQDCFASPEENPYQRNATFWACFGGYITAPHSWSRSTLYSTWNIDDDWNKWTVDWYYTKFYPSYFQVENYTEKQGQYYALAVLHRVTVMQYVLNLQGPLPYSQVTNGKYAVPYDDEKTAWHKMFDDLDFAIAELSNAIDPNYRPMSGYDRVYNGDYEKWVKFANSLKLRMAIRISGVDAEYAKQQALSAVNHPIGVMTSNSDSAYDNLNGRFPNGFYQVGTGWGEARLNASITAYMNGYEDPRREKLFTEATVADTSGYIGVRSGIAGANKADFAEYSQWNVTSTTPIPFFVAAEVAFLRAEGALLGWDMGGTAQHWYEEGIRLAFSEVGAQGAEDYIANSTAKPGNYVDPKNSAYNYNNRSTIPIAWSAVSSNEEHLEQIITQKWIANFPNGLEGWCDFRRTGYPYLFPAYNNQSTQGVTNERQQRRLRFSLSEYQTNNANVTAAVGMLSNGQDSDNTDLWWAKKN